MVICLLRKSPPGSLVLQNRWFYGYRPLAEGLRRDVHLPGRVGKHVVFERTETLSDGPYPAVIYPSRQDRRHQTHGLMVRVIEYTLDAPNRTAHGERHRPVTILLDADQHPAKESVVLYHQRWEIEIGKDDANPACQAATLSDKKRQVLRSLSDNGSRTSRGRSPNVPDAMMPRVRRERHRPASWPRVRDTFGEFEPPNPNRDRKGAVCAVAPNGDGTALSGAGKAREPIHRFCHASAGPETVGGR